MKKEKSAQKSARLSLNECLMVAIIALVLVVALSSGKKEDSSSTNQKKEVNVITVQEEPVVKFARVIPSVTQEVIPEGSQISSKVAERLRAAGFSTQLAEIRTTSGTQKEEK